MVIGGYFGFENMGDEAVLFSEIKMLREIRPSIEIEVLSNTPEATSEEYLVKSVNRWKLSQVIAALQRADVFILGGGSLFQDVSSLKSVVYYYGITQLALWLKKPVLFLGQGFGPLNSSIAQKLVKNICNNVKKIYLRDEGSLQLLQRIGVTTPMKITADSVFALAENNADKKKNKRVAFVMRDWKNRESYAVSIAKVADYLMAEGWTVEFIAFHLPEDEKIAKDIIEMMVKPAVLREKINSVAVMEAALASYQLVIGMRLHALIMAANLHTPSIGISYDPKVDSLMGILQLPYFNCEKEHIEADLMMAIAKMVENYDEIVARLALRVAELSRAAKVAIKENFE